ncbi:MAG: hypothetical protein V3571_10120, partial [Pseudodesulfovibrio sp.]
KLTDPKNVIVTSEIYEYIMPLGHEKAARTLPTPRQRQTSCHPGEAGDGIPKSTHHVFKR